MEIGVEALKDKKEALKKRRHELGVPHNQELVDYEIPVEELVSSIESEGKPRLISALAMLGDVKGGERPESRADVDELDDRYSGDEFKDSSMSLPDPEEMSTEELIEMDVDEIGEPEAMLSEPYEEIMWGLKSVDDEFVDSLPAGLRKRTDEYIAKVGTEVCTVFDMETAQRNGENSVSSENAKLINDGILPENHPEFFKEQELEISEAGAPLAEAVAFHMLDLYESRIEAREENLVKDPIRDSPTEQISAVDRGVDWEGFADKYGSVPENRDFYETAVRVHENDRELDLDFLKRTVADASGYNAVDTGEIRMMDSYGDLKSVVDEKFDYGMAVMEKEAELKRVLQTIENAAEFYTEETKTIVRES